MRATSYLILLAVILASAIHILSYADQLPLQVASRFGANGQPNGFMSKQSYILLMIGLSLGVPLVMVTAGKLARVLPSSMVNLPNKDYWLHPDRRESTLNKTEVILAWIGIATSLLLMSVNHLTLQANIKQQALDMTVAYTLLVLYFLAILTFVVYLYYQFRLPRNS